MKIIRIVAFQDVSAVIYLLHRIITQGPNEIRKIK
jgi:hypothetical protein